MKENQKEKVKRCILAYFERKKKVKTKHYQRDIFSVIRGEFANIKKKEFNEIIKEMIAEKILMYFSTGSTTMLQLFVSDVDENIK